MGSPIILYVNTTIPKILKDIGLTARIHKKNVSWKVNVKKLLMLLFCCVVKNVREEPDWRKEPLKIITVTGLD